MAFEKTLQLPSQISGNYHRVDAFRWNKPAREASILIGLYLSKEAANAGAPPIVPILAKFRIYAEDFDAVMVLAQQTNMVSAFYQAMKAAALKWKQNPNQLVATSNTRFISDYGKSLYWDATNV